MSFARWLRRTVLQTVRGKDALKKRPAFRCRPWLEELEGRCVPASGWVSWNEWPGAADAVNPASPTATDVINFTLFDHTPGDLYSSYARLGFDEANKIIDVLFVSSPPQGYGGEGVQGLYGQLWSLAPGLWTLRGPQSSIAFSVTGDPVPWLEISDVILPEGDSGTTDAVFTVSLSVASAQTVTVDFATADYSWGMSGSDYLPVSGSLTFAPGETTKTIAVPIIGDTIDENYETFRVMLSNPSTARLGPDNLQDTGWGTIKDDETSLYIYPYWTPFEGDFGTTDYVFSVYMMGPSEQQVTVDFATADGTAQAGDNDYVPTSGSLTFAPGETEKFIRVPIIGDTRYEADETFFFNLSNPVYATLANAQSPGIIRNDDPMPSLTVSDVTVVEGNTGATNAVFTVRLSAAIGIAATVNFASADGAATAGSDYQAASGTLTFAPGEVSKTIAIPVIGDRLAEPNETLLVNLSSPSNATIADGQGVGTIMNDEPRISISDVTKAEGRRGQTTLFVFTVTLSAAYDQAVTMSYRTVNGTAKTSDNDYIAKTATLTFAPGETTKTITIEVKGDSKREAHESFFVDLYNSSVNSLFTKNRGLGTILNDD